METKQQSGRGIAPRWAVRLKRELKETRKECAKEAQEKELAELYITNAGLWIDFKKWASEKIRLEGASSTLVLDSIEKLTGERNYWKKKYKERDETVEFWQKDSEQWRMQVKTMLNHCNYLIGECKELKLKLNNQEAHKNI